MKALISKKLILVSILILITLPLLSQTDSRLKTIRENYIQSLTGTDKGKQPYLKLLESIPPEKEVSDQNVIELQQLYPISESQITELLKTLRPDGSWPDIQYNDTKRSGWEPKRHAERILMLSKFYYAQKQKRTTAGLEKVGTAIHKSMNYWFTQKLVCKNWWYNQIGIPRTLGPAFLLFAEEMSAQEKKAAIEVMLHSKFGMTGQNKVWLAGNVLIRGLLEDDFDLVQKARDIICSEIVLGQKEGIKADWSFHQHGSQQQFGNYGLSFICNMSLYSELFAGTPLAFDQAQQTILVDFLMKGYQWIVWRGRWDVNALNRQLFHNADIHKSFNLLFAAYSLMKGCPEKEAKEIKRFIESNFLHPEAVNTFTGYKHFGESDLTIFRTPLWMASVRMASNRVIGTELVNEDNLKGYYMADGAIYTYSRGDEYHNIFPFWDWRKIPGITTYESTAPIPTREGSFSRNHSSFVDGISDDGKQGITTMILNRNGLIAHKAWVFTDEYILCLGSNIHSDSTATLLTSIDQRLKRGELWNKGQRYFHDNTGYIVLQADSCVAQTEKRKGQWHDFMGMYIPEMLENEVVSIYICHKPHSIANYQYVILSASTRKKTEHFDTSSICVIQNDERAQAVIIGNKCYAAVYQQMTIKQGKHKKIIIDSPGIYIIDMKGKKMNILKTNY